MKKEVSIKSNEPEIKVSLWEGILFNRAIDDVGEQKLMAKGSTQSYGWFKHQRGYLVYWTKYKMDSVYLPDHIKNKFFTEELNRKYGIGWRSI
ncbi:MAG: hypothetical protein AAF575_00060 [Bacteroidota bacterium]